MPHSVTAFVTDLIFATKITSTARSLGVGVRVVGSVDALAEPLAAGELALLIVDLAAAGETPLDAIRLARQAARPPHQWARGAVPVLSATRSADSNADNMICLRRLSSGPR